MTTTSRITRTYNARPATVTVDAINERGQTVPTPIAGEHPLTLYLDKRELVTLMTLGSAPEELALGWLLNQRLILSAHEIAAIQVDWDVDSVSVTSTYMNEVGQTIWDIRNAEEQLSRKTVTTGCGQGTVFGDMMAHLESIRLPDGPRVNEEVIYAVMQSVRSFESIYKEAGAVHGCALCSNAGDNRGSILKFVEDVGRHNAVDAIAGYMALEQIEPDDKIFYTTGRLTSEMVIKCANMGIPVLLSRSGLTQMGYSIAQQLGLTMIGRCQGKHYLLFTGQSRYQTTPLTAFA